MEPEYRPDRDCEKIGGSVCRFGIVGCWGWPELVVQGGWRRYRREYMPLIIYIVSNVFAQIGRSEGLAVASLDMVKSGMFSGIPDTQAFRVDGESELKSTSCSIIVFNTKDSSHSQGAHPDLGRSYL